MKKFTFIAVDEQVGFGKPTGRLYVKGGEVAINNSIKFIEDNHENIQEAIFTVDFHSYTKEAYTVPNITWPFHCMAYSEDAGIVTELIEVCIKYNIPIKVFVKGNAKGEHTEYGAFEKIGTFSNEDGSLDIIVNNRKNNSPIHIITSNIVVAGIAGDYCVMNTIKNLMKYHGPIDLNISVFKDGIANIDDGTTLDNFIKENNLKTI